MNNRNLALKISKHPLIELLKKDKAIPNSVIARLIVEGLEEVRSSAEDEDVINKLSDYLQDKRELYDKVKKFLNTIESKKADPGDLKSQAYGLQPNQFLFETEEEWKKQLEAIKSQIKFNNLNEASRLIYTELEKRIKLIEKVYNASNEREHQDVSGMYTDYLIWLKAYETGVAVVNMYLSNTQDAEEKTQIGEPVQPETTSQEPTAQEPEKEEPQDIKKDPQEFDVEDQDLNSLISASELFIDTFYEQAYLRKQAVLLNNVLTQLAKIVEKEDMEQAARRRPQEPQTEPESQPVAEQQESSLRNIQVDLKSFIKLAKTSKEVLERFEEASKAGKVIGSTYKSKFIEMLSQLQDNIKVLVKDISELNPIQEAKEPSELEKKWDAIEKGYNDASRPLSNIVSFGSDKDPAFDMEKNVTDAYNALMSISHYFPSVNPFGKKTSKDFGSYLEQYGKAITEVKSVLRDVLELSQGKGGRNTAANAIKALKQFSGSIQNIFDVQSKFEDITVKPNEKAAQGEAIKSVDTWKNKGILKLPQPIEEKAKNNSNAQALIKKVEGSLNKQTPDTTEISQNLENIKRQLELSQEEDAALEKWAASLAVKNELEKIAEDKINELQTKLSEGEKTEIIKRVVNKVIEEKDLENTQVSLKKPEPVAQEIWKEIGGNDEIKTAVQKIYQSPEVVINKEEEKLSKNLTDEEKKYAQAYANAVYDLLKKKGRLGTPDEPKYKSDIMKRMVEKGEILLEKESDIIGKLSLSQEEQKEIQNNLSPEIKNWRKEYRKKKPGDWADYQKQEFGELVLILIDKKIFEDYKTAKMPSTEFGNLFGFSEKEFEVIQKLKNFLDNKGIKEQLEIPQEIADRIEEFKNILNEEEKQLLISALKKAAKLQDNKKEKFYKFMAIPLKSDMEPTENVNENKLTNLLKPLIREMLKKGNKK